MPFSSPARIALLVALLVAVPTGTPVGALAGPSGQFQPSPGDRDGDGLADRDDCAPDDPTRPSRSGTDADCDGRADAGAGMDVAIAGPADGAPDSGEPEQQQQSAAAHEPAGTVNSRRAARRAAGEPVRAVRLRLGPSIAAYAPSRTRRSVPTLVLVATGNSGVTVRPKLIFKGGRARMLKTRTRSLPRGRAYVVRLRLSPGQRRARRLRFAVRAVDAQGDRYRATRSVRVG